MATEAAEKQYQVTGKYLVWTPEQWDDEDPIPDLKIPLRLTPQVFRKVQYLSSDNPEDALEILGLIAPKYAQVLENQIDFNEQARLIEAYFTEYQALQGVSLGEAPASADG